jgi:hypothetical protein
MEDEEELTEGFYSIYHTNDLKEGILNISGKIQTHIVHNNLLFLIPNDENMKVGELQILIGKHIELQPNKFIMTSIGFKSDIYIIIVEDLIFKLTKNAVEYFQVHEHNYHIDFLTFKILSISLKNSYFITKILDFKCTLLNMQQSKL